MDVPRRAWKWGGFWALAVAAAAGAQLPAAPAAGNPAPLLTLGTPALRSTMERWSLSWLYPSSLPDMRLKVDRPTMEALSAMQTETRVRGVEFRLPMEGFWIGYETPNEDEVPRATFSIQRGF